jgi:hypothetical protein
MCSIFLSLPEILQALRPSFEKAEQSEENEKIAQG